MGVDGKERIWPTLQNLDKYLLDTPEHKQRYDLACDFILGLECADVSCGAGYGSFMLSNAAKKVIGYDVSKEALIHAKKYFQTDKVQFDHLDEFHSKKFDAIISFETLEHMDEKQGDSFLANICNNLKSEGTLIISTPLNETKYRENVTKFHIREYSNQEFKLKLENAGFTIDKWFGQSNSVSKKMSKKS